MRKKFLSAFMLGALTLTATSTFVSCKDYDGDISALQNDVTALQNQLNTLKGNLEGLQAKHDQDIQTLTTQLNDAKTKLQEAIDKKEDKTVVAALADRVAGLETRMAAAEVKAGELQAAIDLLNDTKADKTALQEHINAANEKFAALDGQIVTINGELERLDGNIQDVDNRLGELKSYCEENFDLQKQAIEACEGRLDKLEEMLSDYPEVKAQVATNKNDIANLTARVDQAELDIKANANAISELQGVVDELQKQVNAIDARVSVLEVLVNKRLSSIYFQPSTFIDGVEAINFASLQYKDWGTQVNNWLANEANKDNAVNRIDDETAVAVYHVNPSSVTEESIEGGLAGLSFISNTASNLLSKASDGVVVNVVPEKSELKNGVLTLKLTKNVKAINNSNDDFTIVALKAPLSEKAKTAAEKDQDINVYSDWARLQETVVVPFIHNNRAEFTDGKVAFEKAYAHYYSFGEVYTAYDAAKGNGQQAIKFTGYSLDLVNSLRKETVAYNSSIDLMPLVTVCGRDENSKLAQADIIDYKAYGLAFEFYMLDEFNVQDGGATKPSYTNQQKFGKVTKEGVFTPNAIDGSANNRDAINKTPVVQVVLRDTKNNAIVDVRYIVLQITEKDIVAEPIGITIDGVDRFDCGNAYTVTVSSADMNKMAAILDLNSGVEFTKLYTFDSVLYAEEGDAKHEGLKAIGTVLTKTHGGDVEQAGNLEVTFDAANFQLNKDLYENGSQTVKAYVKIFNLYGQFVYYLPVTCTVKFDKSRQMGYMDGFVKINNYWKGLGDENQYVVANPTLRSNMDDASTDYDVTGMLDTQLIYNLLNAFAKDGASVNDINKMIKNLDFTDGDEAWFEFDQPRMKEVTGMDLYLVDLGQYQILKQEGTDKFVAILWKNTGKIQLWENAEVDDNVYTSKQEIKEAGKHGVPSELAKKIVDYSDATEVAQRFNGIPVKVMGKQCDYVRCLDQFIVRFERPLDYSWTAKPYELKDQWDAGSSETQAWDKWFSLKEAFGQKRIIVGDNKNAAHANLKKWYGVQLPENYANCSKHADKANWIHPHIDLANTADFNNVVVNATYNGKKLSEYKDQNGSVKYVLTYTATMDDTKYGNDATFTFYNNSGNAITEDMEIKVPVTIATKWKTYPAEVIVKVKQITTTAK